MSAQDIANQFIEGMMIQKYGPDFRQKQKLLEAQTATEAARPGLMGAQTEEARAGAGAQRAATSAHEAQTARLQYELDDMKKQSDEMDALVKAGKIPASNKIALDYMIKNKEAEIRAQEANAQIESSKASAAYARARTAREVAETPTPAEAAAERGQRRDLMGAQIKATNALEGWRQGHQDYAQRGVPETALAAAQDEADQIMRSGRAGIFDRMFGSPAQATVPGTPEWNAARDKIVRDRLRFRGYPLPPDAGPAPAAGGSPAVDTSTFPTASHGPTGPANPGVGVPNGVTLGRDAQGNLFYEFPGGKRVPIRPSSVGSGGGGWEE